MTDKIKMTLPYGDVVIQMLPQIAPQHVKRITELVKSGFYNGLKFHRVIAGFMAQTGCPIGDGTGRTGIAIPAEFSDENFSRGAVGMARTVDVNSADSQFFICLADCSFLNGEYTLWGRVVSGMEFVDKIKQGDDMNDGRVENPDKIIKIEMVE